MRASFMHTTQRQNCNHRNGRVMGPQDPQFLAKNKTVVPQSPILTRSGPLWYYSLPHAEASGKGLKIRYHWRDSRTITVDTWHNSKKGTSRDASKHGRNAGTAVFVQKGSTLKVMEKFNIQGKQTSFYKYWPGTFGYTLVIYKASRY
jgi:hypothetical protein